MPNLDGFGATVEIRALKNEIHQPQIVALSAEINAEVMKQCEESGIDHALQKPAHVDKIVEALYLSQKRLQKG